MRRKGDVGGLKDFVHIRVASIGKSIAFSDLETVHVLRSIEKSKLL